MLRTLTHYWRVNVAVGLGAAVTTAVLTGALLVGDSVRGSLRDLTLDRLGRIDTALVADRFFRETLADDLLRGTEGAAPFPEVAPAIVLRGTATNTRNEARASQVGIHGVDSRFTALFGDEDALDLSRRQGQVFPSIVINESLQRELEAEPGDAVVLSFGTFSEIPRETLMGETDPEDLLGRLRLVLTGVIPDRGIGRFSLAPHQQKPHNVFVDLKELQRARKLTGEVNGLFAVEASEAKFKPDALLRRVLRVEDLGLRVERRDDHLTLESREFVLRPDVDRTIDPLVAELGSPPMLRTQSYLANSMHAGDRLLPYSLIAALDPRPGPAWASLTLVDGSPATAPTAGGILLNDWAAEDLQVSVGDSIELRYFSVGPREELREELTQLEVEGIVAMRGLAADPSLTPDYPGIQDAGDMTDWDPPFPVDLGLIRPKDEQYWDEHRATPKAFVSEETGRRLWATRFGTTTAVRIGAPEGLELKTFEGKLRRGLLSKLDPQAFGLGFQPVRAEGLRAAAGATDFAGLFIAFSFFLIVSAALLVGLLFRLGVEQRAGEIGLLLAVGHRVRAVRARLLAEGGLLAALGGVGGLIGGVIYAWLMMTALRTIWRPAVGSSELFLHVSPMSLLLGWLIGIVVVLFSVAMAVRKLVRLPPQQLLAGSLTRRGPIKRRRLAGVVGLVALAGGIALPVFALATGRLDSPGLAFGTGSALLIAGLAFFALWCRASRRRAVGRGSAVAGMAARNSSWNPGRSMLSVALVASAAFVIVVVGAFRGESKETLLSKDSGLGGFSVVAESETPIHQNLGIEADRLELGFSDAASAEIGAAQVFPFRLLPGDDASCLNLYRPEKPRLLGVTHEFVERGGFRFQTSLDTPDGNPWRLLEKPLEPGVIPAIGDANSVIWILHLGLGKELVMENELGEPIRLRLVGLLSHSFFQSELLISEKDLLEHFPSRSGDAYFLLETPAEAAEEVALTLESTLAPFGLDATTTRKKLAGYKVVENTYLSTFQLLGGLGLLLGTLGLAVVLLRNVIERRGELATLRAFGFRRSRLAWLVLAENAFLLVVGIATGALAALAAVAPRLAGAHVPWGSLLMTLGVVLLVGMLSSVMAVIGTLRVPLLPALKAER